MRHGFTLFEVLIYVAILSVVLYFVGGFAYNIYMGKDRINAVQDLNSNGRFMLDTITSNVGDSLSIVVGQ
jgi:prepilin-type N-terminal cleavage/methylation domain-containing protein